MKMPQISYQFSGQRTLVIKLAQQKTGATCPLHMKWSKKNTSMINSCQQKEISWEKLQ